MRGIRIPDPQWQRLEDAAQEASEREGRTVSASEMVRRLIDREYPTKGPA